MQMYLKNIVLITLAAKKSKALRELTKIKRKNHKSNLCCTALKLLVFILILFRYFQFLNVRFFFNKKQGNQTGIFPY